MDFSDLTPYSTKTNAGDSVSILASRDFKIRSRHSDLRSYLNALNFNMLQIRLSLGSWMQSVSPDWAIYCSLGDFSKPVATIILPKLPTLLRNFCKGVKITHFQWNNFWATFIGIWRLVLVTLDAIYRTTLRLVDPEDIHRSGGWFTVLLISSLTCLDLLA